MEEEGDSRARRQHHRRARGQSPLTANEPPFPPLCLRACCPVKDGLSGAPEGRDPGDSEEGEREPEEEAGGGAEQAERRGA